MKLGPELAHYYKFGGLPHGHTYRQNSAGRWNYDGDPPIPFLTSTRWRKCRRAAIAGPPDFNVHFTNVLNHLQQAWVGGKAEELSAAVTAMRELETPARKLIQTPIAGATKLFDITTKEKI